MKEALAIKVTGIVQGVGFRPFIYRIALEHHISGWVCNAIDGVNIHAEGETKDLDAFTVALSSQYPPAAQVKEISFDECEPTNDSEFVIRFSDAQDTEETTLVSSDLATCDDCLEELFDPDNRRYRYPFINCTNCGPRFTIIKKLPYDRANTTMSDFAMCDSCQKEYDNPADRRFHAQPDACFECGPHLGFVECEPGNDPQQIHNTPNKSDIQWAHNREESDALIACTIEIIRAGGIVAVKGLGGYHLVCDASNEEALCTLRVRKHREGKAFAVMVSSLDEVKKYCEVNLAEEEQLTSPARPIVLLKKKQGVSFAKGLADKLPELGVMLPSNPLQHLLLRDFGGMLVMTSGNMHDEPIVTTEEGARTKLSQIADALLVHNREIESRYDDSVVRILSPGSAVSIASEQEEGIQGQEKDLRRQEENLYILQVIRRARGLAPRPISLNNSGSGKSVLAVGPEQKNTLTLTRGDQAFVSQHIGDMENAETFDAWLETKKIYSSLFKINPEVIACDYHPEYLTSKWAHKQDDLPVRQVQHHHAHILSVMGENNLEGPVCGIAFDGTGYGLDGAIWGGEVLLSNLQTYERFANFAYMPLPGGASAIKYPNRCAYGALWACDLLDHSGAQKFLSSLGDQASMLDQMIEKGINTPMTSSVGRIFDAASALLGICSEPNYEGEAAVLLEAALDPHASDLPLDDTYQITVIKNTATKESTALDTSVLLLDPTPVFEAMLDDMQKGESRTCIAKRFHDAFAQAIVTVAELVRAMYDISTVTLSGGVFMNRYLMERSLTLLQERGFTVALNRDLPPNDASISYGQAVLALHSESQG